MWTRSLIKSNAKAALSGRYWVSFAVCFVAGLLGAGGLAAGGSGASYRFEHSLQEYGAPEVWTGNNVTSAQSVFESIWSSGLGAVVITVLLVSALLGILWAVFMAGPLSVGRCRYFMESRQSRTPFGSLFSTLRSPYLPMVRAMFLTGLKIFVGYLLFIIPGIVWTYQYLMVPYLLAENPYMTTTRAMELSRQMMHGEKWHAFVLELSFLGWIILAMIPFGLGLFFLDPYYQATFAELYAALRSKALAAGMTDANELAGFIRH